jgi:pimeloyl-ACP methyl ester carboxylesterase
MAIKTPRAIDKTVTLDINGSTQRVRMCAARTGLPPLLVVQAGPGLPVLHEVAKFQRRLNMEGDFLVSYWERRGCGTAPKPDAGSVSLHQQVDDLRAVLRWLRQETNQRVVVLGISLGGAIALQAVEDEHDHVAAVVVVSPDAQTSSSDASVYEFLQAESASAGNRRLSARVMKLGKPPYTDAAAFQGRASLLTDLGTIERGKTFSALVRETLFAMIGTYGLVGTIKALRNLNLVQRKLLPDGQRLDGPHPGLQCRIAGRRGLRRSRSIWQPRPSVRSRRASD